MRILQALYDADPQTTAQLRERLPDIAPATMYRHIATLADAGVLEVDSEKRVRGTVERSYRVVALKRMLAAFEGTARRR